MKSAPLAVAASIALASLAGTGQARAQCCPGYDLATACSGVTLTKSRWCIQHTVPTGQAALPKAFCAYGEQVISTLEAVFGIQATTVFEFELDTQTGGAHTGTACSNTGDGAAYDGFTGAAYGATDFWGYLLSMHEAINVWTGMSSPGWPLDWWADHQSAFPNLMDFHIMGTIGTTNGDPNLIKAAAAQKQRFYPGGDTADSKVVALDNVFAAMPKMDGFGGFSRLFALRKSDGVQWDGLGVGNPDQKRSEYVIAYMSLAAGKSVLSLVQGPGANGGGGICSGTRDSSGDPTYTCSESNIDSIATAHCAIKANGNPAVDLSSLRSGKYSAVQSGPCGSTCPGECACDSANHCVPPWLGLAPPVDAGADGDRGAGTDGGPMAGDDAASDDDGASGDAAPTAGSSDGSTATAPDGGDELAPAKGPEGGCACQALGAGASGSDVERWLAASMLAAVAFGRGRVRKR